jgi:hypothetical protein
LTSVPIAAFLAGALLTLLLPVALLIALSTWYWVFSARVPETSRRRTVGSEPSAANAGPTIPENLPPDPAA